VLVRKQPIYEFELYINKSIKSIFEMIIIKKINLLLLLILLILGSCTTEPKPVVAPPPPPSTLPLALLSGTWEVSDTERNGKNTTALEGIYFTFTSGKQLLTNFNLSVEERTFSYRMEGDMLFTLSDPEQSYLIESLTQYEMILRTRMEGYLFRLTLQPQKGMIDEAGEEI